MGTATVAAPPAGAPEVTRIDFTVSGQPCSVNRCYRRSRNGQMFMSARGRAFKEAVARAATLAIHRLGRGTGAPLFPPGTPLALTVDFYFDRRIGKTTFPLPDDDGPLKPLRDSLEGLVYEDDKWIVSSSTRKHYSKQSPGCLVSVTVSLSPRPEVGK